MISDWPYYRYDLSEKELAQWHMIRNYRDARMEHAFMLKLEGLKLREIGDRMGVSRERARQMVRKFSRRMRTAISKARWSIT